MNTATTYAQVVLDAAHKDGADAKAIVRNLAESLQKQGRSKLLPKILVEMQRLEARSEKLAPMVEVAHEKDAPAALRSAAEHGIHATKAHVNHDLITGWRAAGNGKLIDQSAKRSLIELYRKVTTP